MEHTHFCDSLDLEALTLSAMMRELPRQNLGAEFVSVCRQLSLNFHGMSRMTGPGHPSQGRMRWATSAGHSTDHRSMKQSCRT